MTQGFKSFVVSVGINFAIAAAVFIFFGVFRKSKFVSKYYAPRRQVAYPCISCPAGVWCLLLQPDQAARMFRTASRFAASGNWLPYRGTGLTDSFTGTNAEVPLQVY